MHFIRGHIHTVIKVNEIFNRIFLADNDSGHIDYKIEKKRNEGVTFLSSEEKLGCLASYIFLLNLRWDKRRKRSDSLSEENGTFYK